MKIDITLLEKQITSLGNQLNKPMSNEEREDIECLLNLLGDLSDKLKSVGVCCIYSNKTNEL
jgi:hypothetical protein